MKRIKVGMLGFGTVGTGVARILLENRQQLQARVGVPIELKSIADIDLTTDRGIDLTGIDFTDDAKRVLNDPEIDMVLELIGGETIAREFMIQAIQQGKHVVTANKALLASHGNEIFRIAAEKGVDIAFEASVGGCMPVIKTLREALVGNRITAMAGILNGTCNYILSRITDEGITFEQALSDAQANGYAEADPTLDIEGIDTAHKLALMTALAYGMQINLNDIYTEGISKITPMDIQFAGQFGYRVKLLAISKYQNGRVEARIHPTMIPFHNLMSGVNGTLNAVMITGDAVENVLLYGHGAGMMPTASAVVGDIVDIARNILNGTTGRIPMLAWQRDQIKSIDIMPMADITTHYYFRFSALDKPGVLSKISGILGDRQISIKSVHQKGRKINGTVPIVMLTHRAKESAVIEALDRITDLDVVSARPILIRIEDEDGKE